MSHAIQCPSCGNRGKPSDAYCSECGFPMGEVRAEEGARDALVGKTLPGGYRVVEPIAEGSMGRVYRAEQATLGRAVAVKVMSGALVSNAEMVERFKNEARAASALNHPNCVRVYDFGQTPDGRPYFVMELLTGQDLEAVLRQEPLQPVTRVLDVSLQILSALEEAHGLGVIHRDLKPGNVFVMPQRGGGDLVKVVDFGLAKLKSGISAPTGRVFGTPEYITPEQAMAKETDERTDLYACGVMLFEMVAGRLPFDADSPKALLEAHVYKTPPKLGELAPERSMFGLDDAVERALEKNPANRFQNATDFADALREIVAYRTGERSATDRRSWVRTAFKACASCGNLNAPIARFCGECGDPLDRESNLPPVRDTGPRDTGARDAGARDRNPVNAMLANARNAIHSGPAKQPSPPVPQGAQASPTKADGAGPRPSPAAGPPARPSPPQEQPKAAPAATDDAGPFVSPKAGSVDGRPMTPAARAFLERSPTAIDPAPPRQPPVEEDAAPVAERRPNGDRGRPVAEQTIIKEKPDGAATSAAKSIEAAIKSAEASGDPSSALVFLEQIAGSRLTAGDPASAILALLRGIDIARDDLDKGELDDPIRVVAIFSAKLGEAYFAAKEFALATRSLKDGLALSRNGPERARIWMLLAKVAEAQGHAKDAADYIESADREAVSSGRRTSSAQAANDSSSRRRK